MDTPGLNDRYGLEFGTGSFVGNIMQPESDFFDTSVADQALRLGWVDGCPIPEQLIDSEEPGRGAEAMRQRYAEVNFWFGQILDMAWEKNPKLLDNLTRPFPRYPGDLPEKYEEQSVPESYETEMAPMDTLWGYAIPRVFIEQLKGSKDTDPNDKDAAQQRLTTGLAILEEVIPTCKSSATLLAKLSERVAQADADPVAVLHHALSKGKLDEENQPRMWVIAALHLQSAAPELWKTYASLTAEQLDQADIVNIDKL